MKCGVRDPVDYRYIERWTRGYKGMGETCHVRGKETLLFLAYFIFLARTII